MNNLDGILAGLADPARRKVVDVLRLRPRAAGELAAEVKVSPQVMSKHLRVLRTYGLVEERRVDYDNRIRLYQLCPQPFADLQAWLDQVQAFWAEQLQSFKHVAEQEHLRGGEG